MTRLLTKGALFLFALTILLPLLWIYISSLKTGYAIIGKPWSLPTGFEWKNFANAWNDPVAKIGVAFVNSVLVTAATLLILIPIGAMAAYIFARYKFPGSNLLFGGFLGGMMFPNFLVIVPLFFLLRSIDSLTANLPTVKVLGLQVLPIQLYDTRVGLTLVYVAYSLSFTIFVLTGFFQALPGELAEAAMIDGCGHTATFRRIMMPLARPGLLVVAIFNAIGLWNEYALALVLVPSDANHTLPVGLANLAMNQYYQSDWGALFAGMVIVVTPVLVVYWLLKEKIHEVMLAGALKG